MQNMELSYQYKRDLHRKQGKYNFVQMQEIIKNDFKKMKIKISDCPDTIEKEHLLAYIDHVIQNICQNRFITYDALPVPLAIQLTDEYLLFSYFECDTYGNSRIDTPNYVIASRSMSQFYFIKTFAVPMIEETEKIENQVYYFSIYENKIVEEQAIVEEKIDILNKQMYQLQPSWIVGIRRQLQKTTYQQVLNAVNELKNRYCATCKWCISPEEEDMIMEEQGYEQDDPNRPQAGDCCLEQKHDENFYCELYEREDNLDEFGHPKAYRI